MVFIDEATIEYDPCPVGKLRVQLNKEVYETNLRPSFKSRRMNVEDFFCIARWSRISLI